MSAENLAKSNQEACILLLKNKKYKTQKLNSTQFSPSPAQQQRRGEAATAGEDEVDERRLQLWMLES